MTSTRIERRTSQQRFRRRVGAALLAVVAVATGLVVILSTGEERRPKRAAPSTTTTTVPKEIAAATTLASKVPELIVYESPQEKAKEVTRLSPRTRYGVPRTLLAVDTQPGWYQALLPIRPNGSTGWVRADEVAPSTTPFEIRINLAKHRLRLLKAGEEVLASQVVIGKPETPTPPGRYYVTDPVDLKTRRGSAYGAFALGISGFSEVLLNFEDGPGQLAVHGTPNPEQVGQDISNGCIRVPDDVILQIATLVPLGTPVTIVAGSSDRPGRRVGGSGVL